ncbi:MAG: HAMP domain-containing protein [Gemmatimonadaceae bacterium]|nr:HAMP domain-containing protein [Gloeobacterales cyanobacterium ES-bin-141]
MRAPLRLVLIVPFVLQVFAVGLTAYLSLRNGQLDVDEVTAQLRSEVTARIHEHVSDYVKTPQLVTHLNINAVLAGQLVLQNGKSLERHFWQQMQLFDSLSAVGYGSRQGDIHAVERLRDGSFVIRAKDRSTNGNYHTYTIDNQGNRVKFIQSSTTFEPRSRPWYTTAIRQGKPGWTDIYPYFSSTGLAVGATRPLYDKTGTVLGATNATISLVQLSNFLRDLKIGRSGQTFIIERSGNLVASSVTEQLFTVNRGSNKRVRLAVTESRDRVTRLTARYLHEQFGNLASIRHNRQIDFESNGKRQFVQIAPLADEFGLNWMIVVVLPEADFMERIEANTRTTILLCLGALLLATVVGIVSSYWITQPILRLISALREIASGKLDQTVAVEGVNELRVLARAHNQMVAQLQASFTALGLANEELELRVEQRTAELQEKTRDLKRASDYESVLKRVADRVRDSLDETQILQTVVQELTSVLVAKSCAAAMYDPVQRILVIDYECVQSQWPSHHGQVISLEDNPVLYQSLSHLECVQFCQLGSWASQPPAALLVCPVFDDQGTLANLWLFQQPDYTYSDLEIRLVQQVANQCAIAIRQARLYQVARSQVEELRSLHCLKDDFLSTVSHEIRTPISNMKLAIYMLKRNPTPEQQQQYLDILQIECARECDLINDLLDMQRLEADRYSTVKETILLQEWIPSVVKPFLSRTQEREQVLRLDLLPDTLPVNSDSNCLGRILAELLNNACKYTLAKRNIHFQIRQYLDFSNLNHTTLVTSFEVSNQAEISASELPHIFEKFYRIPSAHPWAQSGTGLGLALVQKLVKQLGGELRVQSHEGWTSFMVVLKEITQTIQEE